MKELQIQKSVIQLLQYERNKGNLLFVRHNTGALVVDGKRFIRFGLKGLSDIVVYFKGGKTEFWEIKSLKGKQSEYQKEFEKDITKLGFTYRIIRDISDVKRIFSAVNNTVRVSNTGIRSGI